MCFHWRKRIVPLCCLKRTHGNTRGRFFWNTRGRFFCVLISTKEPSLCAAYPCLGLTLHTLAHTGAPEHKGMAPLFSCFSLKLELLFYSLNVILRMSPYLVPSNGTFRLPQTWNQLRVRFLSSLRYNTDWSVIRFAKSLLAWIVRILLITF